MFNAVSPVADPIGFIVFFFLVGVSEDWLGTVLKLAVLCSVIVFPFTLLGKRVYDFADGVISRNHLVLLFVTSILTVFVFVITVRLWYVLMGSSFMSASLPDFAMGFLVTALIAFVFALVGDLINYLVHQTWKVPQGLTLYVIDLIVSFVFFMSVIICIYVASSW